MIGKPPPLVGHRRWHPLYNDPDLGVQVGVSRGIPAAEQRVAEETVGERFTQLG